MYICNAWYIYQVGLFVHVAEIITWLIEIAAKLSIHWLSTGSHRRASSLRTTVANDISFRHSGIIFLCKCGAYCRADLYTITSNQEAPAVPFLRILSFGLRLMLRYWSFQDTCNVIENWIARGAREGDEKFPESVSELEKRSSSGFSFRLNLRVLSEVGHLVVSVHRNWNFSSFFLFFERICWLIRSYKRRISFCVRVLLLLPIITWPILDENHTWRSK